MKKRIHSSYNYTAIETTTEEIINIYKTLNINVISLLSMNDDHVYTVRYSYYTVEINIFKTTPTFVLLDILFNCNKLNYLIQSKFTYPNVCSIMNYVINICVSFTDIVLIIVLLQVFSS